MYEAKYETQVKKILVDGYGYVYSDEKTTIIEIVKLDESMVGYKFGNKEFNGSYVIMVEYYK